jgi:HAD superfamily hydrolase (TIGR01509 family)
MTVRAVVFDVGETIVDETRIWGAWADHLGIPRLTLFAALGAAIARDDHHQSVLELFRPGLDVEAEAARMAAAGRPTLFTLDDLYPDAVPTMRALAAAGYRLGLAANQPSTAEAVLRSIDVPLDLVAMSDSWGLAKPDPAFFERLVRELGLEPREVAYVGDRLDNDIRPAAAAGMVAVLVRRGPWGWVLAGRDDPQEATLVVESLAELPDALARLG